MAQCPYCASKHTLILTRAPMYMLSHTHNAHTITHNAHTWTLPRIHCHAHTHCYTHMHCHTCSHTTYTHSLTSSHNHKLSQAGPKFAEQPKLPCSPPRNSHQLLPHPIDSGKSLLDPHVFSGFLPLLNLKKGPHP